MKSKKLRKKIISVVPNSKKAKFKFSTIMKLFHSCTVIDETEDFYYLQSLNQQYYFWLQKEGNSHWSIVDD